MPSSARLRARTRATGGHSVRRVLAVNSRAVPHRSRPICRTGTSIEKSRLKFRKWVFAVCLFVTNPKGIAGTMLAHEFKVQQMTAWFMLHRLCESRAEIGFEEIADPVEADESWFSGERMNMSRKRRGELKKAGAGRGTSGQAAVAVLKDRTTNKVAARHAPKTGSAHVASLVAQDAKLGSSGKKPARETLASFGSFSEARSHHAHHPDHDVLYAPKCWGQVGDLDSPEFEGCHERSDQDQAGGD